MLFSCSKVVREKLSDYTFNVLERDSFSIWNVHEIQIGHKKALVYVNDLTQFNFMIYGVKKNDYKQLNQLFYQHLTYVLMSYGFTNNVIKRYFDDENMNLFRFIHDKTSIARMNKVCMRYKDLYFFGLDFDKELMNRIHDVNDYFFNRELPYKIFINEFKSRYQQAIDYPAIKLEIELLDEDEVIKRDLICPIHTNFLTIHEFIQALFGWTNSHLHQFKFTFKEMNYCIKMNEIDDDLDDILKVKSINETDILLSDVINQTDEIVYEYDFGCGWNCLIKFKEKIESCDLVYAECYNVQGIVNLEDEVIYELENKSFNDRIYHSMEDYLEFSKKINSSITSINLRLRNTLLFK